MSMSRIITQDLLEVESRLEENDLEGAKDLFQKLKDDTNDLIESVSNLVSDFGRD